MTGIPDPEPPLDLPGPLRIAAVPVVAGALAAWIALTGGNPVVFHVINAWPARTGDALWANLTMLGEGVVVLSGCTLLIRRRPRALWAAILGGLLGFVASHAIKHPLDVDRPVRVFGAEAVHVIGARLSNNSFPSGHATSAFAAAALLFALVRSAAARAAILAAAALIASSRVAVGAHWPLDVLAGAALGWTCGNVGLHLAAHWSLGLTRGGRLVVALLPLLAAVAMLLPDPEWAPIRLVVALGALATGLPAFARLCASSRSASKPNDSY